MNVGGDVGLAYVSRQQRIAEDQHFDAVRENHQWFFQHLKNARAQLSDFDVGVHVEKVADKPFLVVTNRFAPHVVDEKGRFVDGKITQAVANVLEIIKKTEKQGIKYEEELTPQDNRFPHSQVKDIAVKINYPLWSALEFAANYPAGPLPNKQAIISYLEAKKNPSLSELNKKRLSAVGHLLTHFAITG